MYRITQHFSFLGEVIEYNDTEKLFSIPSKIREQRITSQGGLVDLCVTDMICSCIFWMTQLTHMGELCETAIAKVTQALKEGNTEQAKIVIKEDEEIDQIEKDIERLCLKLLLQQQPVARDLRRISAALKMITDMERIGDQTSDIAEIIISSKWEKMDENLDKLDSDGNRRKQNGSQQCNSIC